MHLLGLNWQLQPADGHTFNNGIRTGLPGNDDVATMPSGGKGEVTAAAGPLEVTGMLRAPTSWLIQIWEDMQNERKGEEKEGEEGASPSEVPLFRAVCCSCLLAVFGCSRWSWQGACLEQCAYLCYLQLWQALQRLESIPRPGQSGSQASAGESPSSWR